MPIAPSASKTVLQNIVKAILLAGGSTARPVDLTFTYRRLAVTTAPSKASFNTIWAANVYAPMLAAFNQAWTAGSSNLRFLDDALNPTNTFALAGAGAIATDRLPSYNAVYMLLRTGIRGAPYRSSKHFPAANEADTTGDILTGAGLARWQAVQTAMALDLTDADGNVWRPCVPKFKGSQIRVNPTNLEYNDVTEIALNLRLGTMRKRKSASAY